MSQKKNRIFKVYLFLRFEKISEDMSEKHLTKQSQKVLPCLCSALCQIMAILTELPIRNLQGIHLMVLIWPFLISMCLLTLRYLKKYSFIFNSKLYKRLHSHNEIHRIIMFFRYILNIIQKCLELDEDYHLSLKIKSVF